MAEENQATILLVEDSPADTRLIQELLQEAPDGRFNVITASTLAQGLDALSHNNVDAVLLDLGLPDSQGLTTFKTVYERVPYLPIVMLTILDDEELARTAVREGAQDYLTKDALSKDELTTTALVRTLRYAMERTEAEATLRASAEEFRALFERSPVAKIRYDAGGHPTIMNDAALVFLGVTEVAAVQHINLFSTPRISAADQERLLQGQAIRFEQRYDFEDLRKRHQFATTGLGVRYTDIHITPLLTEAGVVKEYIGEFVDITERKRTERALHEAHEQMQALNEELQLAQAEQLSQQTTILDAVNDAIIMHDERNRITYWNKGAERLYGWSAAEAKGLIVSSLLKTKFPVAPQAIETTLKTAGTWNGELLQTTKDDRHIVVECRQTMWHAAAGISATIFEINTDITERKHTEERLRAASLYARSLIEASLDPLVTISADGKITDVNKATEEVTGFSREELVDSDFSSYFTEPNEARKGYQHVFAEGFVRDYPLVISHRSGKITDVLYNATVYRNEAGEIQGVFAAARDITERKQTERALQEAHEKVQLLNEQLQSTNEELKRYSQHLEELVEQRTSQLRDAERLIGIGETAAMVGHDLRNPLQGLQYIVDLQRLRFERLSPDERSREEWQNEQALFAKISDQIFYMDKIVGDLQDYARPIVPEREDLDIKALIDDVI
ncbi:MAG TPA: PAS domain S-box protein, partial [Candidatus Bathyarchaeia archaeon]|nr:PAS domain S-box protein [Candidatus Bathyarchaeia archaeon]